MKETCLAKDTMRLLEVKVKKILKAYGRPSKR